MAVCFSASLVLYIFQLSFFVFEIQVYNGDDYNGARIISRAYELRDAVSSFIFSPGIPYPAPAGLLLISQFL